MVIYIIKSVACLAILFAFYKLFLEKENMHRFKRFYLIGALLFSLLIPLVVFTEYIEVAPLTEIHVETIQPQVMHEVITIQPEEDTALDFGPILWGIYFVGLLFFGLKFIRNLFQIYNRIRKNPKQKLSRFTQVLLQEKITPHTFFSYIFLNKTKFESKQIPKEVLLHEETHAQQKHSLDVVFVELLQVIFWVNPLIYLAKKAIKLNHEFLADQAVLQNNIDETTYKNILLSYLSTDSEKKYQPLANAINYSSIKKRFTVMKTHTSKKAILLRSLLLFPLLALLLYGFSETKVETIIVNSSSDQPITQEEVVEEKLESESKQNTKEATLEEIAKYNKLAKGHNLFSDHGIRPQESEIRTVKRIYSFMSEKQKRNAEIFPDYPPRKDQTIASPKQIAEYNALAKKYNTMLSKSQSVQIKMKDVKRLEYIYSLMSKKQKASAEAFPNFPPIPEIPTPPKAPKAKKGERSNIPPPPPLTPNNEELKLVEEAKVHQQEAKLLEQDAKLINNEVMLHEEASKLKEQAVLLAKQESRLKEYEGKLIVNEEALQNIIENQEIIAYENVQVYQYNVNGSSINPPNLIEYVQSLAKQDAHFYFNGKKVSTKQGLQIVQNNKNIRVETHPYTNKKAEVRIHTNQNNTSIPAPPIPPKPVKPIDHVIEMAKKDAVFYYEGKEISANKAIEILKNNNEINIDSRTSNGKKPIVKLAKEPFTLE